VSALHPTEIYKKREILPLEAEVYLLPIPTCRRPPLGLFSSTNNFSTSTTHPLPFYTDPSRMDTDEDGVTDYIELQGWDVIVIHERRGEVMEDRCEYGVWSLPIRYDSEGDGASDETEWKFHGNPDSSDSDKDGIPDREESGPNLTMVEGTPPVILDKKGRDKSSDKYSGAYIKTKVKIKTKWSISGVKIKGKIIVIFTVVDNAGLDRAVIYVQTGGERIIYLGRDKRSEIEEVFDIGDLLRLIHGGYDVRVNVTDINGNWATGKTHIDSALQTLKKGLSALLDMIVAALKVIAKVASMLLDVIKKIVKNMFKPIIEAIKKSYREWCIGIYHVIDRLIVIGDTDDIDVKLLLNTMFAGSIIILINLLAIGIIYVLEPLVLVLQTVTGVGAVADSVLSTIGVAIAKNFLKKLLVNIAISTILVMFGEVLSAIIPHDDPVMSVTTAVGTLLISIIAIALQKYITHSSLSFGDRLGLFLVFLGYFLSLGTAIWEKYKHIMSVIAAGIAGLGLAIALCSPDMPGLIGFLDEGIDSILFGFALNDAVGG